MGSGTATLATATQNDVFISKNCYKVGVIPRVLNDLFQIIEEKKAFDSNYKFTVRVSFVEVYNEEIKVYLKFQIFVKGRELGEYF